jgi:hypothetical protein
MLRRFCEEPYELSCGAPLPLAHQRRELTAGGSGGEKGKEGDQEGEAAKERGYDGKGADRIGLHAPIVSAPSCHLVVTRSPLSCT